MKNKDISAYDDWSRMYDKHDGCGEGKVKLRTSRLKDLGITAINQKRQTKTAVGNDFGAN